MQFLVIYHPPQRFTDEGPPDDFREVEDAEEVRLQELYTSGSARQAWALDTEYHGAAVIYEANSAEEIEEINQSYPLIQRGYAELTVYPLAPYPGFAPKS